MNALLRAFVATTVLALPSPLLAQGSGVSFGMSAGASAVGGSSSRVLVTAPGNLEVTGAGQTGFHVRGIASYALENAPVDLRAELFYNRLRSEPNTFSMIGGENALSALTDDVLGLNMNVVAMTNREGAVAPFALIGAGLYRTRLGTNADPADDEPDVFTSQTSAGFGLGGGLEFRWGERRILLEARFQQSLGNGRGSAFIPITLGVIF